MNSLSARQYRSCGVKPNSVRFLSAKEVDSNYLAKQLEYKLGFPDVFLNLKFAFTDI